MNPNNNNNNNRKNSRWRLSGAGDYPAPPLLNGSTNTYVYYIHNIYS